MRIILRLICAAFLFPAFHSSVLAQYQGIDFEDFANMKFKERRVIPPYGEAAELGKFGNVPVSLFTGSAKVSIPIHEFKGTTLQLPISLAYSYSGFRPQEQASWVGLGWTLNAGGVITRSVMGNPDADFNYYNPQQPYLPLPNVNDQYAVYDYITKIKRGEIEASPDVYYFNFPGGSGKFVIKPSGEIVKKEKSNLTILASNINNSGFFTIKDQNGWVYTFSATETATTTIDDKDGTQILSRSYSYISSWHLSEIQSPDGDEKVTFTYSITGQPHTNYYNLLDNQSVTYETNANNSGGLLLKGISAYTPPTVATYKRYLQQVTFYKKNKIMAYVMLTSETNQRQDLNHNYFPDEKRLTGFEIYSLNAQGSYNLLRKFILQHSYFTNTTYQTPEFKRLRLDAITELPADNATQVKPQWIFSYNNQNTPGYNASVDHWGFYNGELMPVTLVPSVTYGIYGPVGLGANREPDFSSAFTNALVKIQYPTGGSSEFQYEGNQARKLENGFSLIKQIGGIRIKQIVDYASNTQKASVKQYQYILENNQSSGISVYPNYLDFNTDKTYSAPAWGGSIEESVKNFITVSANSTFGLGQIQGSHIGYKRVIELQVDTTGAYPLGKTIYYYRVGSPNPETGEEIEIPVLDAQDDFIGNGDLIKQEIFNNNDELLIQKSTKYSYQLLPSSAAYIQPRPQPVQDNMIELCKIAFNGGYIYNWKLPQVSIPTCVESRLYKTKMEYGGYGFSAFRKLTNDEHEVVYNTESNAYENNKRTFYYENDMHDLPTKVVQNSNFGDSIVTIKKYPYDYNTSMVSDQASQGIALLKSRHIYVQEIEQQVFRLNPLGQKKYIAATLTTYDPVSAYPRDIYALETQVPLSIMTQSLISSGNFSFDANYKKSAGLIFQQDGSLLQQGKDKDAPKSYIWGYSGLYPTAEALNANYTDIAYSSFETEGGLGNWNITGNLIFEAGGISGNTSFRLCTNYSAPQGNVSNQLLKGGLNAQRNYTISYWSKGAPVQVIANGQSINSITGESRQGWIFYRHNLPVGISSVSLSAANQVIDELRLHPADAQMSSYTYEPFKGITTAVTPNSRISYIEYDGYQRALNVFDQNRNLVKHYAYNYGSEQNNPVAPQGMFYNTPQQQSFVKQSGCPVGAEGESVLYRIPYGKHAANTLADANQKAQADIAANGQAFANRKGRCVYYNDALSQVFTKNNCGPGQGAGSNVPYFVAARTYFSYISKADANQKALADIAANGQANANAYGFCDCSGDNKRVVNGICETGVRYNIATTQLSNGQWQCAYIYLFSDGSYSQTFYQYSSSPCNVE